MSNGLIGAGQTLIFGPEPSAVLKYLRSPFDQAQGERSLL